MGKRYYLIPFIVFLFCSLARSQTISSTAAGGPWLEPKTWEGEVVPPDSSNVIINGPVTLGSPIVNNLTINSAGSLEDECCAGRKIIVIGDFTNYGTIKDIYGGVYIEVKGNVHNFGKLLQNTLGFTGDHDQYLESSTLISCKNIWKFPDGKIIASGPLTIDSTVSVDLRGDILDMGKNKLLKYGSLTNQAPPVMFGGTVHSNGEIDVTGRFESDLDGNFTLTGDKAMEFGQVKVHGDLLIAKGKQIADECCAGRKVEVDGNLINYGRILDHYAGLEISVKGNIYNYSQINNRRLIQIAPEDTVTEISGIFNCELFFRTADANTPGKIRIADSLISNKYTEIQAPLVLEVPRDCKFCNNANFSFQGTLDVMGMYFRPAPLPNIDAIGTDETFLNLRAFDKGKCDTVFITLTNTTSYPEVTSSIQRWWHVIPNSKINSYSLKLKYSDDLLNSNDPDTLSVYLSQDQGKTWKRISTPFNTVHDRENKIITVGNETYPVTEELGDIILSSGGLITTPSISSAITGRKQIRIGAPNRYTVAYWNSGDVPTDDFFMTVSTQGGVHILSAIFTDPATGKQINLDVDSLTYGNKDEMYLFAPALSRNEARNFDVILTADQGTTLQKAVIAPAVYVVVVWVGGVLVKKYIKSSIKEGCYEMWRPVKDNQSAKDACTDAVVRSIKSAARKEKPVKIIAEEAAKKIIKDNIGDVIWPLTLGKDILDCLGNTIRGMKDYVNGSFDESSKELVKTTSWDPNAKEGPGGYGPDGYMASSDPMTYTIYFENKKEATAPAYKIVVWDTLDQNVFDLNTVAFGKMSHSMGVTSKTGNILKWEFTGIELPPNLTPPEGEGWVQFTVHPKANLSTGTVLRNRSTIVFDLNPPLSTNTAVNTLDFEAPVTTVTSLTYNDDKSLIDIAWTGNDKSGSGINTSTVFMANGDGPYTQACVSDSGRAKVAVLPGQTYKFYVVSQDNVGNTEKNPSQIKQIQTGIDESNAIPEKFELMQNYPNPFNPVTNIKFTLKEPGHTVLKIYNILGQVVRVLLDKDLNTGYHKLEFNAGGLASGVYFYHLTQKNNIQVKKMMLIK